MWRYREWLPLAGGEVPVTLGEGGTPLLDVRHVAGPSVVLKDESGNPTGSFKARGLSAAVTRAAHAGATAFVVPTAGNAGVALAAYATRAGCTARVYAPRDTPPRMLEQMDAFGAELVLIDGHIGTCGKAARAYAAEHGAVDVSTLREPYRIEGKKTLGLELAEQLGWRLPDAIIYPTGGGTGLIGMWKAFAELRSAGWVTDPPPRMFSVQAEGCAPVVDAWRRRLDRCEPPAAPHTVASGLRVPTPLGDRLMLAGLRESGGGAVAVSDEDLLAAARRLARDEGVDAAPEGGAALAAYERLCAEGVLDPSDRVVLFNTGAGWLYAGREVT
jgi:threonine synthase